MSNYYDAGAQMTKKAYEKIRHCWEEDNYLKPDMITEFGDSIVLKWDSLNHFSETKVCKEIKELPENAEYAYKLVMTDECGCRSDYYNEAGEELYEDLYIESAIHIPEECEPKQGKFTVKLPNGYLFIEEKGALGEYPGVYVKFSATGDESSAVMVACVEHYTETGEIKTEAYDDAHDEPHEIINFFTEEVANEAV